MKSKIRLNLKFKHEDKQNVINIITSLPTGIRIASQAQLKTCHRFIFILEHWHLLNALFGALQKGVTYKYSFMPEYEETKPKKVLKHKQPSRRQMKKNAQLTG